MSLSISHNGIFGKVKLNIWRGFLDRTLNSEKALEDPKKVAIHGDVLANFDTTWGGNNLLYHRSDVRVTTWHICSLNVGLVGHAWVVHLLGGFVVSLGPSYKISPLSFMGLGGFFLAMEYILFSLSHIIYILNRRHDCK